MARTKQANPLKRTPSHSSGLIPEENGDAEKTQSNGFARLKEPIDKAAESAPAQEAGITQLIICVGGIYASLYDHSAHTPLLEPSLTHLTVLSLFWAVLQEQITTTSYGTATNPERWTHSVFLNTIQSAFAALTGYIYLRASTRNSKEPTPSIFPTKSILFPLILVSITSSLASPFGYASLSHIDYITFILAKSCKLLPVMFLHLTIFRKRYPLYKYLVIFLVTAGVAVFTLHSSKKPSSKKSAVIQNSTWGLFLLSINLLFDGLTNTTQDHIFSTYKPYSGPQMMVAQNLLSTLLTTSYLLISPYISALPFLSILIPEGTLTSITELSSALTFISRNPSITKDLLGFAACGAIGQIFIYYTLSHFSSLLLVTVTVTRKMLTMILSVVWFGHRLSGMQWVGVGLVFGGVGAEGWIQRREKEAKERAKKEASGRKEL
ncbi:MAG: UDP-galactose transporter [Icmadophila ericetorum]|nr:UDP-galactose transporter [Icmadophila ericetorum]